MYTHGRKQWSRHAKIHLKHVHKGGINILRGVGPVVVHLMSNKMYREKAYKSYDIIASSEMLSIELLIII